MTKSADIVDIDIRKFNAEYLNNKYLYACLNANKGWIRIKGRNIVLDATNQMHLLANDIRIGRPQVDGTERILLNATEIDAGSPRKGNIADLLKTSSIYRVGLSLVGMTPLGLKAQAISKGISFAKKFFG